MLVGLAHQGHTLCFAKDAKAWSSWSIQIMKITSSQMVQLFRRFGRHQNTRSVIIVILVYQPVYIHKYPCNQPFISIVSYTRLVELNKPYHQVPISGDNKPYHLPISIVLGSNSFDEYILIAGT